MAEIKKRYYLAYGSNLNVRQMRMRCPGAKVVGVATIRNYELLFKGSQSGSYLTIEPKEGARVPVAVWEIGEFDEKALDHYEGFPIFYYKKDFTIDVLEHNPGGAIPAKSMTFDPTWTESRIRRYECFAYIMHEDRPIGIPSSFYVDTCAQGYQTFQFDLGELRKAVDHSVSLAVRSSAKLASRTRQAKNTKVGALHG